MHFCIDNAKKIVEDDQKHEQETAESPAISLDDDCINFTASLDCMKCLTGVHTYIQDNGTDMATLNVLQRLENDCVVKKIPSIQQTCPKLLTILHVNSTSSTACVAITHQIHFACKIPADKAKI